MTTDSKKDDFELIVDYFDSPTEHIIREDSFWNKVLTDDQSELINDHIKSHNIKLIFNTHSHNVMMIVEMLSKRR